MDQVIPIINELQDISTTLGMTLLDLPQIVIVGSQSSGKSSVLENIVGRDFLPRGRGIVTRCPLILQLIHESGSSKETRARFLHKEDVDYYDFKEIKNEINKRTNFLAGFHKNISDKSITLKIYSPDFLTLTLIDLPGLTKVSLESQPKDIEQQIRKICLKYARQENSIILAISQGNVDLANSDSLKFAEELDPEGKRTFSVITKLDIMDKGTNAYDILTGKVLPKELGYIGVVSRSQADINNNKPIKDSLRDEKRFFEEHYPDIAHKNGTLFLTQSLNTVGLAHFSKLRMMIEKETHSLMESSFKKTQFLIKEMILSQMTDAMSPPANKSGYKSELKATCDSPWTSAALQVASFGSIILFGVFKMKCPQFQVINVIILAKLFKDVMNIFDNKNSSIEEKKRNYGPILETTFKGFPNILERKDLIIDYMLNPDSEVYDSPMNPELNVQEEQSAEFNRTVNEEFECAVFKSFVIGYYNMVLENVCLKVPEFIQKYLVIHFRDNLQTHLQRIPLYPEMDNLFEDESIQAERRRTILLLKKLKNMRNRIKELCSTT